MPETITIHVSDLLRFVAIVGPSFILGWIVGAMTISWAFLRAGYKLVTINGKIQAVKIG